ncbi:carboxypeptidase-like regulatory domain-containing protein [Singulisphaera sp. Ch08]|uniref:Carboxypeptidase-like regulatory domain-containing protein n=1 Tax=Singulisphaera sp. Ch08 TaxID=3120278 RepID=A0AAU7CK87_9BACT
MTMIRWAAPLALLGMIGCNSDPDSAIKLVPVKGTVTLDGKPMANAMISFIPEVANNPSTAGGDTTGPDGNYLAQYRNRTGLAPGKYKVTIVPGLSEGSEGSIPEELRNDPFMAAEGARVAAASRASVKKKVEIKGEFDAEVTGTDSPLNFEVKTASATVKSK